MFRELYVWGLYIRDASVTMGYSKLQGLEAAQPERAHYLDLGHKHPHANAAAK